MIQTFNLRNQKKKNEQIILKATRNKELMIKIEINETKSRYFEKNKQVDNLWLDSPGNKKEKTQIIKIRNERRQVKRN